MIPPLGSDVRIWSQQVRAAFDVVKTRITWKSATSTPAQNGVFLWDDDNGYPVVSKGGKFLPVSLAKTGATSDTTDAAGWIDIAHGLGVAPTFVSAGIDGTAGRVCSVDYGSTDATTFRVYVHEGNGIVVALTAVDVRWVAQ